MSTMPIGAAPGEDALSDDVTALAAVGREWVRLMLLSEEIENLSVELQARDSTGDDVTSSILPMMSKVHQVVSDWAAFGMYCVPHDDTSKLWSLPWGAMHEPQTLADFCVEVAKCAVPPSPFDTEANNVVWLDCLPRTCVGPRPRPPKLEGQSTRGLGVGLYPALHCEIVVQLRECFATFSAKIELEDCKDALGSGSLLFELWADGAQLWSWSTSETGDDSDGFCNVDVGGVSQLRLVTKMNPGTEQMERVNASWTNAALISAGNDCMGTPALLMPTDGTMAEVLTELADAVKTYARLHAGPVEQAAQSSLGVDWRELAAVPAATLADGVSSTIKQIRQNGATLQSRFVDLQMDAQGVLCLNKNGLLNWKIDAQNSTASGETTVGEATGEHVFSASISSTSSTEETVFYEITVKSEFAGCAEEWVVSQRYSQFEKLKNELKKQGIKAIKFPEKKIFGSNSSDTVNERTMGLNDFLRDCVLAKMQDPLVIEFLELQGHFSPRRPTADQLDCRSDIGVTFNSNKVIGKQFEGGELSIACEEHRHWEEDAGRCLVPQQQLLLDLAQNCGHGQPVFMGGKLQKSIVQLAWSQALQHSKLEKWTEDPMQNMSTVKLEAAMNEYLESGADAAEGEKLAKLDRLRKELHQRTEECSGQELFVRLQREDDSKPVQHALPFQPCRCEGRDGTMVVESSDGSWRHVMELAKSVTFQYSATSDPCMLKVTTVSTLTKQRFEFLFFHPQPECVRWLSSNLFAHQVVSMNMQELNSPIEDVEEKEQSHSIGRLIAALCNYAANTGQSFSNGTFIIPFEAPSLHNTLKDHTKSYKRISSHLKKLPAGQPQQYGCDVPEFDIIAQYPEFKNGRNEFKKDVSKHVRTVLFSTFQLPIQGVECCDFTSFEGKESKGPVRWILMMKPESHGTQGWSDTINHGIDYIATRPLIAKTFGDPEGKVERKERVPDWSIALFRKACSALGTVDEKLRKKAEGIGVSYMLQVVEWHGAKHGTDPHGDLAEEMKLQTAQHITEQNSGWWTQHPEPALFLDLHQLDRLKSLIADEQGFRYRVGNEVYVSCALATAMERSLKVVQRTRLQCGWIMASQAIPEIENPTYGRCIRGVLSEALVRTFLPQELPLRTAFEEFLGEHLEEAVMALCTDFLTATFVKGEINSVILERLLPCAVTALTRISELSKTAYAENVLLSALQAMCNKSASTVSDGAKLASVRHATYTALAYLLETHFQRFMHSPQSQKACANRI